MKISVYIVDNYLLTRIACKKYFKFDKTINIIKDFSTATECIKNLEEKPVDVVILDIDLPDINGIEACKIIKEKFPKVKVIIFSSYLEKDKIMASLACCANGYILKNASKDDLKKVIKMVVNGEFWLDYKLASMVFSSIPNPNTKDLENLYEKENLKNNLTLRELEVLKLLVDGKTNSQIAKEIIISTNTAKAHVGSIFAKLSVKDRVQAAVKAVRANIF